MSILQALNLLRQPILQSLIHSSILTRIIFQMSAMALTLLALSAGNSQTYQKNFIDKGKFELKYELPLTAGKSQVQRLANKIVKEVADENYKNYMIWHKEDIDRDPKAPSSLWSSEISGAISVNRSDLVSIVLYNYSYMGGAHPNHFTTVINVGMINGKAKRLVLQDILKKEYTAAGFFATYIQPPLDKQRRERSGDATWEISPEQLDKFILTPNGITYNFDPYTAGSYAEGDYVVKLLKSSFKTNSPFQNWVWK